MSREAWGMVANRTRRPSPLVVPFNQAVIDQDAGRTAPTAYLGNSRSRADYRNERRPQALIAPASVAGSYNRS
jgi:hypothetical protein